MAKRLHRPLHKDSDLDYLRIKNCMMDPDNALVIKENNINLNPPTPKLRKKPLSPLRNSKLQSVNDINTEMSPHLPLEE